MNLIEKLEGVVDLVDNAVSNPDIELSYCIPNVAMTAENAIVSGDPYIHLKIMFFIFLKSIRVR